MDSINEIMRTQITRDELIIFNLVTYSGQDYRTLGEWVGLSHANVQQIYERTKKKMEKMADAGFFQTAVEAK